MIVLRLGHTLALNSPVISNFDAKKERHVTTEAISASIREVFRTAGFNWRPYILRVYFDNRMLIAESKTKGFLRDYRVFFMGHTCTLQRPYDNLSTGQPNWILNTFFWCDPRRPGAVVHLFFEFEDQLSTRDVAPLLQSLVTKYGAGQIAPEKSEDMLTLCMQTSDFKAMGGMDLDQSVTLLIRCLHQRTAVRGLMTLMFEENCCGFIRECAQIHTQHE